MKETKRPLETPAQIADALVHIHSEKNDGPFSIWACGITYSPSFATMELAKLEAYRMRRVIIATVEEVRRRDKSTWHGVRQNEMPRELRAKT